MGKIISNDRLGEHNVKKFEFASLNIESSSKTSFNHTLFSNQPSMKEDEAVIEDIHDEIDEPPSHELFLKMEALANDKIALEMELETLKKEFDEKLKEQSEAAYKKGEEEGIKETQANFQNQQDDLNIQLVKSITAIDEQLQRHAMFLGEIENELIDASIIIAKKIIKKELDENSQLIAKALAISFITDLKEAASITLKVNPKDAQYLQEHFQSEKKIKIDADDAINKGGIIILSDIGNIDGNIKTRLEKAIALIEREG